MRVLRSLILIGLGLGLAAPAMAQGIGVLQSAETMAKGDLKLMVAPLMVFGKDGADDEFGVGARGGIGVTDRIDVEAKFGFFDGFTLVGADVEYWLVRGADTKSNLDASLGAGLHKTFGSDNAYDTMGLDLTPLVSYHLSPKLELLGALDASFEKVSDVPEGFDDSYTRLNLVPGLEYKLTESVDLEAEFGLALNDDAASYVGAGVAFYFHKK